MSSLPLQKWKFFYINCRIYNSIIWQLSTACDSDIDAVESVQDRFTKRLPTLKKLPYRGRLKCLNILSLELRRLHTDLFWCYKIVCVSVDDLFVFSSCQYTVDTNNIALKAPDHKLRICLRANFFGERVINFRNSFPHTVDFRSFSKFKRT